MAEPLPNSSPTSRRRRSTRGAGLDRALLAGLLILVGLVLLAGQFNLLPAVRGVTVWDWLMLGAGSLLLLSELVRALTVEYSSPSVLRLGLGALLVGLGLSAIFGVSSALLWPAALVVIGVIFLLRSLAWRA